MNTIHVVFQNLYGHNSGGFEAVEPRTSGFFILQKIRTQDYVHKDFSFPSFSANCSACFSTTSFCADHARSFQTSTLSSTPITAAEFFKLILSLRYSGIKILPIESTSTSAARPNIYLLKLLLSAFKKDKSESELESFLVTFAHSLFVKMNKHWSSPGVIMIFLPSSFLNFTGKDILFFSSIVCMYSPFNLKLFANLSRTELRSE